MAAGNYARTLKNGRLKRRLGYTAGSSCKENVMGSSPETVSMAMFCDFENVALGVRDAN